MNTVEKRFQKGQKVVGIIESLQFSDVEYEFEIIEEFENPAYGTYDDSSKYLYVGMFTGVVKNGENQRGVAGQYIGLEPTDNDHPLDVEADGHIQLPEKYQ